MQLSRNLDHQVKQGADKAYKKLLDNEQMFCGIANEIYIDDGYICFDFGGSQPYRLWYYSILHSEPEEILFALNMAKKFYVRLAEERAMKKDEKKK